jgi:hypothetical protein
MQYVCHRKHTCIDVMVIRVCMYARVNMMETQVCVYDGNVYTYVCDACCCADRMNTSSMLSCGSDEHK